MFYEQNTWSGFPIGKPYMISMCCGKIFEATTGKSRGDIGLTFSLI